MIQQRQPAARPPGRPLAPEIAVSPERKPQDVQVPPSFTRRASVAIGLAVLIAVLALILWYAIYVILLAFAAVLFAVFLRALSDGVKYVTRLPDGWSLTVVIVLLAGVTIGGMILLTPRVAVQMEELRETLPVAMEELAEYVQQYQWGQVIAQEMRNVGDLGDFRESIPALAAGAATVVGWVSWALVGTVVVLFIGIYLAINPQMYVNGTVRLVPIARRERAREVIETTGEALRWWLIGRIIAMAFVGVATALGLWLLGVPLSLSLGILAGLLDFIPNIGPLVAAVPAVLIAFAEGPQVALYVIILYFAIQQLESYIVTPIVQQKAVSLPPALTVFAQLLFVVLAGPLGLLLATPLAAAGLVLVRGLYVHDTLGDKEVAMTD